MTQKTWAIVVACGKAEQISSAADVAFLNLGKNPLLYKTLEAFERCPDVDAVLIAAARERLESIAGMVRLFGCAKVRKLVAGTAQRLTTTAAGLKALEKDASVVVVHEASRPCVQPELLSEVIRAARRNGSGVAAVRIEENVFEAAKGQTATSQVTRGRFWQVQTPQAFKRELLEKALQAAQKKKLLDDEASAVCDLAGEIHLVPSTDGNIKVRSLEDLTLAASLLKIQ